MTNRKKRRRQLTDHPLNGCVVRFAPQLGEGPRMISGLVVEVWESQAAKAKPYDVGMVVVRPVSVSAVPTAPQGTWERWLQLLTGTKKLVTVEQIKTVNLPPPDHPTTVEWADFMDWVKQQVDG